MQPVQDTSLKNDRGWRKAYSLIFLVIVLSFLGGQILVSDITIDSIPEKYLWKKGLTEKYREFKFAAGDRVFSYAIVGKEGWLFYTGEMSLRNYQRNAPLNISNIKKMMAIFEQMDAAVKEYGGRFLLVIPPDKSTIYTQYMPDEIPVIGTTTSLDRLVERINKQSDLHLLDLRPVLIQASKSSQVYYQTDTHWNCLGAFYAYQEIILDLSGDYSQLQGYSLSDFDIETHERNGMDIAKMMGADVTDSRVTFSPKFESVIVEMPFDGSRYDIESVQAVKNLSRKEQPGLMIFHDSFYNACLDFFVEKTFQNTISVPYKDLELADILEMIEKEKPDIVIFEFVERFMDSILWHLYE